MESVIPFLGTIGLIVLGILIAIEIYSYSKFSVSVSKLNSIGMMVTDSFENVSKDIVSFNVRLATLESHIEKVYQEDLRGALRDIAELEVYMNVLMAVASIDKELVFKAADFTEKELPQ